MQAPDLHRIVRLTESWFAQHQRPLPWRGSYDPYHVWVSEIMLQQTRMEVVLPYFSRFLERFPTVEILASSSDDAVTAVWSGLGYYRRARMLRAGAAEVVARFGGLIPSDVDALLTIPGVGRYTAGAIASVAWNRRAAIVDGNVARIVSRLFGVDEAVGSPALMRAAWRHAGELADACTRPRDLNQGLMEIGALICRPRKPSCLVCPLRDDCVALATSRTDELPRAKAKKTPVAMRVRLYLVSDGRGRVLMRRETGPLMHAMYHLPHGETSFLAGRPLNAAPREHLGSFRHTVTTRKIEFELYAADVGSGIRESSDEYEWIDPAGMAAVPHPSYVKKALRLASATLRPCSGV